MTAAGVLWALTLDGAGGAEPLAWEDLQRLEQLDQPTWLHLQDAAGEVREWIGASSGLEATALEAFLAEETRPRSLSAEDARVVFLRGVNLNPGREPDEMLSLRLAVHGQLLLSYRRERMESTHAIHERLLSRRGPKDIPELFVALVAELTRRVDPVLDNLEEHADELEQELSNKQAHDRAELANLRQQVIALRRYLAPQRAALASLQREPPPWLNERLAAGLRESADSTQRFVEDLDALRERAAVLRDELATQAADELNRRMYALSVVTLVFLPLGLLTGLLGINVGGMPGAESPSAFWIVCGLLALLALAIAGWLRALRWV